MILTPETTVLIRAYNEERWLPEVFAALFAVTFAWISFACASAVLGFLRLRRQRYLLADEDKVGRTALLMPVYHEDPETVAEALSRMGRAIAGEKAADKFDIPAGYKQKTEK